MAFKLFSKKEEKKKEKDQKEEPKVQAPAVSVQKKGGAVFGIMQKPRITEKASALMQTNTYTFEIDSSANKIEVKKAVERMYGVKVKKVNVVNLPKKRVRIGKVQGEKQGVKKALVTLAAGQKIEQLGP